MINGAAMDSEVYIKHYAQVDSHILTVDLPQSQIVGDVLQAVAEIEAIVQPYDAWDRQSIKDLLSQKINQLLIAIKAGRIVGYCLYQVVFEQAEVLRIATHPDYQRQGIAAGMLDDLFRHLEVQLATSILLEVRADNTPAIELYQRHGFATIHQRQGYYRYANQSPVDALIMQRLILS